MKRQRVQLRAKVRRRRNRAASLLLVAGLGLWLGQAAWKRADLPRRFTKGLGPMLRIEKIDASAVPDPARAGVEKALNGWVGKAVGPLEPGRMQEALAKRFQYLDGLELGRSYLDRSVTASAALKKAVARAGEERWLSEEGRLFWAPSGLYPDGLPRLEAPPAGAAPAHEGRDRMARQWREADLRKLAEFLGEAGSTLGITAVEWDGPEGWKFQLADGLKLRWGGLERTQEKIAKLSEALSDARERYPGVLTADLRFFADGRILLEPARGKF